VLELWADDGVYHAVPLAPIDGKAAFADFARSFAGRPPPRIEIHHQVASEHAVMNERTDTLDFHGREVVLPICAVFEVRDGRVAAWREYFDPARFSRVSER